MIVFDPALVAQQFCDDRQYQLDKLLGSGSFKFTYLVSTPNGEIALKVARPDTNADRLWREFNALANCAHPAIARFHGYENIESPLGTCWIAAEEYVAGGTLKDRLTGTPIDPALVKVLGAALSSAIAHLYERNLVHRDIKPDNVLFRADGVSPVLTDFGLVRDLDLPSLTADYASRGPGTPIYSAPEQLLNDKFLIDWRTDQYALGIVLAECALGRHPYSSIGADQWSWVEAMSLRHPIPIKAAEDLAALGFENILKMLAPWPVARYRTPDLLEAIFK